MTVHPVSSVLAFSLLSIALAAEPFSWQQPHAKVLPTGDLEWAPEPFVIEKGASVRYIDFEKGNDNADGLSTASAWKHHPWDRNARGKAAACKGIHTYVFKRGAVYRGTLVGKESGEDGNPIRLTSDPDWGKGEATICGSELVTGWKKGADHPDLPAKDKVWYADLGFAPRCVWMVDAEGGVTRLALARTPNWKVSNPDDVKSEWWTWQQPRWWEGKNKTTVNGRKMHLGVDATHLTRDAEYYRDAIIHTEWGIVMGTPFPTKVEAFDSQKRALAFQGIWWRDSGKIITRNRYYLEDKPHYLDSAGEFWIARNGTGGRLYLRLPDDGDPNAVTVEAGRRYNLIEDPASADAPRRTDVLSQAQRDDLNTTGLRHVVISGLSFQFTNTWWDLEFPAWMHKEVANAAIRLLGAGDGVEISNCRFAHVAKAVRIAPINTRTGNGSVVVRDNDIRFTDHGAISISKGHVRLDNVRVLRNRLFMTGMRPHRQAHGHALSVGFPETAEIAGNVLDRCYGAGLFIHGGKGSGQEHAAPFVRILVHHNKVTDSLLNTNDWGGIETWQGGPFYVYNNISGNPGGYWHWAYSPNKPGSARFGHAYYLDGAFKNYLFNNIAWGKSNDPTSPLGNCAAFQEIHSYENTFFNNTVYNFVRGSRRQAPHAGRDKFLGNIWQGISGRVFRHADPAKTEAEGNAEHAGPQKSHFAYETNAYANNVFADLTGSFGVFETSGRWHASPESFRRALKQHGALSSGLGVNSKTPVLAKAEEHDFRPAPGSAAVDRGAKVFVPWSLSGVVAEWNFTRNQADPAVVLDEHWYMTSYHLKRDDYYKRPTYPLRAVNVQAEDYVPGSLENWTEGALRLNGRDQYLALSHSELAKPFKFEGSGKGKGGAKAPAGGWVTVTAPSGIVNGQRFEVLLKVNEEIKGQQICAHLHWLKKTGFGGFNAWGGRAQPVTGPGPYKFAFTPKGQPGLDMYSLLVFLSPTGEWKNKSRSANLHLKKAATAAGIQAQTVAIGGKGGGATETRSEVAGEDLKNPQMYRQDFLIEAYFRIEPGQRGILIEKMDEAGYSVSISADGAPSFTIRGDGAFAELRGKGRLDDGEWHHLIAEADRKAERLTLYLDGKQDTSGSGVDKSVSLANDADLCVGGTPGGRHLAATVDFLRIAHSTLADSKTTIEELHEWQFNGPQYRDFCGKTPVGKGRDAGAIELTGDQ